MNRAALSRSLVVCAAFASAACSPDTQASEAAPTVPQLTAATGWPVDLPPNWVIGPGTGVYVDARDHVYLLHRPERITDEDMAAVRAARADVPDCCVKAPPLIEVDPEGRIVRTLGSIEKTERWPYFPHSVFVDHTGALWIASQPHHMLMKLTAEAEPVFRIGEFDRQGTSSDSTLLGSPADIWVDPQTNEAFVADGYVNRRVAVFDGATGRYLRSWGAYGETPDDRYERDSTATAPPRQFDLVHGVNGTLDGLLYVADASNSRVQVFRRDGTYVSEVVIDPANRAGGRITDVAFSADPEQRFLYVADGTEHKIWIVARESMEVVGEFGSPGSGPGQFGRPHNIATDSRGNIYVAEAHPGRRFQKIVVDATAAEQAP